VPTDMQELASDVEAAIINAVAAAVLPAGVILPYGGGTAPTGFLLCDGSAVSRTTYAALFAAIGTTFGPGNGSTTFNLPDLRDRVAVGSSATKARGSVGGEATHTLTNAEMPAHSHGGGTGGGTTGAVQTGGRSADHSHSGGTDTAGSHTHGLSANILTNSTGQQTGNMMRALAGAGVYGTGVAEDPAGSHSHGLSTGGASSDHSHYVPGMSIPSLAIASDGGGATHNNLQPYVAVTHIIKI
jgi:microcystin-dependent protein